MGIPVGPAQVWDIRIVEVVARTDREYSLRLRLPVLRSHPLRQKEAS